MTMASVDTTGTLIWISRSFVRTHYSISGTCERVGERREYPQFTMLELVGLVTRRLVACNDLPQQASQPFPSCPGCWSRPCIKHSLSLAHPELLLRAVPRVRHTDTPWVCLSPAVLTRGWASLHIRQFPGADRKFGSFNVGTGSICASNMVTSSFASVGQSCSRKPANRPPSRCRVDAHPPARTGSSDPRHAGALSRNAGRREDDAGLRLSNAAQPSQVPMGTM